MTQSADPTLRYVIIMQSPRGAGTFFASAYPASNPRYSHAPTRDLSEAGEWDTREEAQAIIDAHHKGRKCIIALMQSPSRLFAE